MFRKKLKLLQGNYIDILSLLFPSNFSNISPQAVDGVLVQLNKDIPRSKMFCSKRDRAEFAKRLTAFPIAHQFYLQGDLDARIFTCGVRTLVPFFIENFQNWVQAGETDLHSTDLSFIYMNDNNILCGFSLAYLYNDTPLGRVFYINAVVITDVTAHPLLREVVVLCDPMHLSGEAEKKSRAMQEVNDDDLTPLLKKALNSEEVFKFVEPVLTPSENSFLLCRELDRCFSSEMEKTSRMQLLYDVGFIDCLLGLNGKVSGLYERGCEKAGEEMQALVNILHTQKQLFIDGKLKLTDFVKNCEETIAVARKGEMQLHRGLLGKILNGFLHVLNKLSLGCVRGSVLTDSMFKTNKMSAVLATISHRTESSPELKI
jgi:hypothetical protein